MFRRFDGEQASLHFEFEGDRISAITGETVAAALLRAGIISFRETPVSGQPRAPYCMMGVCFDCLVEIDGLTGRQACLTLVRDGMLIRRPRGAREIG